MKFRLAFSSRDKRLNRLANVILALTLVVGALAHETSAETLTVSSSAMGQTERAAIDNALVQAVEQATGVKLEAERASAAAIATKSTPDNSISTQIEESFQEKLHQKTGGIIKGFDVQSVVRNNDGYTARLIVNIERFKPPGLPTQERRRIVVAAPINLAGLTNDEIDRLRAALNAYLIQTRRFAVLDRQNDAAYRSEMDLLKSPDAAAAEAARTAQVLGADYVLLAKVRKLQTVEQEKVLPITDQHVRREVSSIDADFVIVDIATRQLKWAGQIVDERQESRTKALEFLARKIGEEVVGAIYPLRVIQTIPPRIMVINQGADTIKVGQSFTANRLGDMAYDTYTKEPLGRAEYPIGTVTIDRVDPKLSYGRLMNGDLPAGDVEIVLRSTTSANADEHATGVHQITSEPQPKW